MDKAHVCRRLVQPSKEDYMEVFMIIATALRFLAFGMIELICLGIQVLPADPGDHSLIFLQVPSVIFYFIWQLVFIFVFKTPFKIRTDTQKVLTLVIAGVEIGSAMTVTQFTLDVSINRSTQLPWTILLVQGYIMLVSIPTFLKAYRTKIQAGPAKQ